MNRFACLSLAFVLIWCAAGCKNSASADPPLAKVKGTVNLDGKAMAGGEIRFTVPGRPVKAIEIKDGAFAGDVYTGKNLVEVVWDKDGPPNPMDPSQRMKVNTVAPTFSGPNSTLSATIEKSGATDLKFDVTSARKR